MMIMTLILLFCCFRSTISFHSQKIQFPSLKSRSFQVLRNSRVRTLSTSLSFAADDYGESVSSLMSNVKIGLPLNIVLATAASQLNQKALTPMGLLHATLLGTGLFSFQGYQGWILGVSFFALGSIVTSIGKEEKEEKGIAEKRGGSRGPENVWGSGATALVCAFLSFLYPSHEYLRVAFVASLATKAADTVSSEMGKAFGKKTYLITTLKRVPAGTEGGVSVEGTVAGSIAAVMITMLAVMLDVVDGGFGAGACVVAALLANSVESVIGATAQRQYKWLTNEVVNFINTTLGAIFAAVLFQSLMLASDYFDITKLFSAYF